MLVLLEDRGLVARAPHPTDGRARTVALTPAGRQVYRQLWRDGRPVRDELLATFRAGEADALIEELTRIAAALADDPELMRTRS